MTVADTFLSQIQAMDYWAMGAWGAYSLSKTPDALYIRVKGPRFAGKVGVHYHNASDTYIVWAYRRNEETMEILVVEEKEDAHAEELVGILDSIIG